MGASILYPPMKDRMASILCGILWELSAASVLHIVVYSCVTLILNICRKKAKSGAIN